MASWIADHEYALQPQGRELRETSIARQRDKISDARVEDFIRNAEALYEDGGQTRDGVDRYATQDKLREAVDDADVEAWVRGQIRGVLGEPGIYNGKERFTASGKRRSFRETHGAYTAENIVKAMNRRAPGARATGAWAPRESYLSRRRDTKAWTPSMQTRAACRICRKRNITGCAGAGQAH